MLERGQREKKERKKRREGRERERERDGARKEQYVTFNHHPDVIGMVKELWIYEGHVLHPTALQFDLSSALRMQQDVTDIHAVFLVAI